MSRTAIATWLRRPIIGPLYRQHLDVAYRLLAPDRADCGARGAARGFRDGLRVAPAWTRHGFNRLENGIIGDARNHAARRVSFRDSGQLNLEVSDDLAPLGDGNRDRYDSDKAEPAPVGDGARLRVHQEGPILVEAAGGHLVGDSGIAGRQPHQVAVATLHDLADARAAGERGMFGH